MCRRDLYKTRTSLRSSPFQRFSRKIFIFKNPNFHQQMYFLRSQIENIFLHDEVIFFIGENKSDVSFLYSSSSFKKFLSRTPLSNL